MTVHKVLFPETDFQVEGLAGAVMLWAREEFGIVHDPLAIVAFDREANRFDYAWQGHQSQRHRAVRMPRPRRGLGPPPSSSSGASDGQG
ncbi:hypothetical protein GUY60_26610 [Streptomyces sp. YC537]|uniref:Uncharacterized protein n=1 Tax=Streptomyces boluensis TaxID=1775135 RepID=A0A964UT79_9ACTN|nr:hypothetical protein [Streptomyces boluensis]